MSRPYKPVIVFLQFLANKIDETNCNDIKMAGIKLFSCFVVNGLLIFMG